MSQESERFRHRLPDAPSPPGSFDWDAMRALLSSLSPEGQQAGLARALDELSEAVVVRSRDGRVLFANPAARSRHLSERDFADYEEFDQEGLRFQGRGLRQGDLSFTVYSQLGPARHP